MTNERINPELMMEAARMAYPKAAWHISEVVGAFGTVVTRIDDPEDENEMPLFKPFDPISYKSDAWTLEGALKKEGWRFYYDGGGFRAFMHFKPFENCDSDTLLLLKCVSAQSGIPLYLPSKGEV